MHVRRLRTLSVFLRTIPANLFDLKDWFRDDHGAKQAPMTRGGITSPKLQPRAECGYTGCAVGWAASIPSFRRAGFYLARMDVNLVPTYEGGVGRSAVKSFFGLDGDQVDLLFMEHAYPHRDRHNPNAVADRIDALIANAK
jgi:hypothetical protein